jgi:peptidoglycan L-alanyl-D-glutamate endopeptidase CwlK
MNTDEITLERIKTAHPFLRNALLCIYKEAVLKITNPYVKLRFSCVIRSPEQQNIEYAKGRTTPGSKVTWVKAWGSYHQYGLAVDIVLLIDKDRNGTFEQASWNVAKDWDGDGIPDWLEVVKVFEKYGWQWGLISKKGKHFDLPHFQRTFGYTTADLQKMPKDLDGYPIIK